MNELHEKFMFFLLTQVKTKLHHSNKQFNPVCVSFTVSKKGSLRSDLLIN